MVGDNMGTIMYNPNKDYYGILGISPNSNTDDIVDAYYNYTFNGCSGFDLKRSTNIEEAYDVLSNPRLRSEYDRYLKNNNMVKAYEIRL